MFILTMLCFEFVDMLTCTITYQYIKIQLLYHNATYVFETMLPISR